MSTIIKLLGFEEGWRSTPYVDTEGYPTVGYGFKLGPRLPGTKAQRAAECHRLYAFTVPRAAGDAWLDALAEAVHTEMLEHKAIQNALAACNTPPIPWRDNPRSCVLVSMAYQMGIDGLAGFTNTLRLIASHDWFQAETNMLKSKWANQTPARARRHALQMRTGVWLPEYS